MLANASSEESHGSGAVEAAAGSGVLLGFAPAQQHQSSSRQELHHSMALATDLRSGTCPDVVLALDKFKALCFTAQYIQGRLMVVTLVMCSDKVNVVIWCQGSAYDMHAIHSQHTTLA